MKDIVSNCFLCGEHSLHVAGTEEAQVMQCINCGYVTSTKYIGTKETNEEFQKLSEDMKEWSIEESNRIWIPTILTLPIGMLYPFNSKDNHNDDERMKWAFAPMIKIPEDERKNFPNDQGGFYEKKVDTDDAIIYDKFFEAMIYVNKLIKETTEPKETSTLNLPKLKKK